MRVEEHGVDEWLPGGLAVRAPIAAEVEGVDFTVNVTGARPRPAHAPQRERATVDLNDVDFEGLIALGVSVGQAARFISQRERRGGIAALSDLGGFYGLAPGVRDILRWSGYVRD